jgi:hypothetical protein
MIQRLRVYRGLPLGIPAYPALTALAWLPGGKGVVVLFAQDATLSLQ